MCIVEKPTLSSAAGHHRPSLDSRWQFLSKNCNLYIPEWARPWPVTEVSKAQGGSHENVRTSMGTNTLPVSSSPSGTILNPLKTESLMRPHWKSISPAFYSAPALLHMPTLKAAVSCGGGKTHGKQLTEPLNWDHVVHICRLPSPILQMNKVRFGEFIQVTLPTLPSPNWLSLCYTCWPLRIFYLLLSQLLWGTPQLF